MVSDVIAIDARAVSLGNVLVLRRFIFGSALYHASNAAVHLRSSVHRSLSTPKRMAPLARIMRFPEQGGIADGHVE